MTKSPVKYIPVLLTSCALAGGSLPALAQGAPTSQQDHSSAQQDNRLSTDTLVRRVLEENAQVVFAEIQKQVTAEKVKFEQGAYQAELFSNLKYDDAHVQRSAGDKLSSSLSAQNKQILNESNTSLRLGVRQMLTTGGEVTVSYSAVEQNNNIIPSSTDPSVRSSEFTTALSLQVTQPLLQGLNNVGVESRIRRAELEVDVVDAQYRQQLLKLTSQGLSSYWQLYKGTRFLEVRELAVVNGEKMVANIAKRVESGKESESALIDAKSELLKRKVARDNARQALNEVSHKISTLMNADASHSGITQYVLESEPNRGAFKLSESFEDYYQRVLSIWPNAKILQQNIAIQHEEIRTAEDKSLPTLDLELGYTSNDLAQSLEMGNVFEAEHPSWYVGLNFSMPLGEDQRAKAQKTMAILKQDQYREDLNAVKISLKNDLRARLFQVSMAYQEVNTLQENIRILEDLYQSELRKFNLGYGDLKEIYQRENSLNLERHRYIDGLVKYELAKVSLALADGSLLNKYLP